MNILSIFMFFKVDFNKYLKNIVANNMGHL